MVETELVTDDIASGERAVKALDEEHADVRSAFWLYDRDAAEYRLVLALPAVDREGPATGYKLVQRAFKKHRVSLPLRRVVVVGVGEPLARSVHRAVGTIDESGATTMHARFGRRVVDGLTIDDAYVYRST